MREYKFRGKRVDNKEWVEGWYLQYTGCKGHIISLIIPVEWLNNKNKACLGFAGEKCENIMDVCSDCIEVIPETVGQYIEKNDKNGKEIWVGDIVRWGKNKEELKVVTWSIKLGGIYLTVPDRPRMIFTHFGEGQARFSEVIGNHWDSPELLEKE